MLLVHAAVVARCLHVWAESGPQAEERPSRRPKAKARASPHDSEPGTLVTALTQAVPGLSLARNRPERLLAWLPTVAGEPLPSSPLLIPPGTAPRKVVAMPRLVPWSVSVIPLTPAQAVTVLGASIGRDTLAPGLVVSKDLAWWAHVLRFAGALVARQRFLPGIVESEEGWRARWTPVLAGADAHRRLKLASAMPGACRALSRAAAAPPQASAIEAVDNVVAVLVDQLVRTAGGATPALKPESGHEAWLRALATRDGVIDGAPADLARLAAAVREWRRPVAVSSDAPFRLCFRLEEPTEEARGNDHRTWSV